MKKKLSKIKFKILQFFYIKKYKRYRKMCRKNNYREWIIFNSPIHSNIGDHAIILAEYKILEKMKIYPFEVSTYHNKYYFDYIKKHINNNAIISITGGGFIGSQWIEEEKSVNSVVNTFYKHKIVIFPQTIYFKEDDIGKKEKKKSIEIFAKAKDLIIFARENKTYEFAKETYKNAKVLLAPDMVLYLNEINCKDRKNGILFCLRNDVEGKFSEEEKKILENILKKFGKMIKHTDTVVKYPINAKKREEEVLNKIKEFSTSEIVITDRLHGMIFAAITDTPCIVFGNYNYKVEGVYQWIKNVKNNILFEHDIYNIENDIRIIMDNPEKENKKFTYDFNIVENTLTEILGRNS